MLGFGFSLWCWVVVFDFGRRFWFGPDLWLVSWVSGLVWFWCRAFVLEVWCWVLVLGFGVGIFSVVFFFFCGALVLGVGVVFVLVLGLGVGFLVLAFGVGF